MEPAQRTLGRFSLKNRCYRSGQQTVTSTQPATTPVDTQQLLLARVDHAGHGREASGGT
jgi:hypothetical protein